jgi:hypothetical protein
VTALLQTLGANPRADVLETIFYTSIVLNLGATTCAVLCLIILSDFKTKARVIVGKGWPWNDRNIYVAGGVAGGEQEVLRQFGLGRSWSIARTGMVHCFLLGTVSTFAGMGVWVWSQCATFVAIFVTSVLGLVSGLSGYVLLLLMRGQ